MIRKFFKLDELNTTVRRECIAGITTFLTMAYIILVNPNILAAAGMDKGAVITATILASAFGTLLAGIWANVPLAMAPGMGLNAMFAFVLVLGNDNVDWQTGLGVVFISGILFLILTLAGIREKVVNAIPVQMRLAIAAGIGLFITFIGFQKLGLIVKNDATMISLAGSFSSSIVMGLAGLVIIAVLAARRFEAAILVGIAFTTILGMMFGKVGAPESIISAPPSLMPVFLKINLLGALKISLMSTIFSFMFVDLFDSVGTIVACSYEAGMVRKDGTIPKIDKILQADAVATVVGAALGTSTTTAYIESAAGIAAGGRSGLTSVVTAALFLISLLFTDIIKIVPDFATAPALIIVGVYMFKNVKDIEFSDFTAAVPAFLTIILMPLTFSISIGLCFGFVSHIIMELTAGRAGKIHPAMWGIGIFATIDILINAI